MDKEHDFRTTDTSRKVMDRIMHENRWSLPEHKQKNSSNKNLHKINLALTILFLVGISVSFIFINPTSSSNPVTQHDKIVAVIKSIDFAKTYYNLDFIFIQESAIASIGEPHIYQPSNESDNSKQTLMMLSILGISMITLFMNWLSRGDNDLDHT